MGVPLCWWAWPPWRWACLCVEPRGPHRGGRAPVLVRRGPMAEGTRLCGRGRRPRAERCGPVAEVHPCWWARRPRGERARPCWGPSISGLGCRGCYTRLGGGAQQASSRSERGLPRGQGAAAQTRPLPAHDCWACSSRPGRIPWTLVGVGSPGDHFIRVRLNSDSTPGTVHRPGGTPGAHGVCGRVAVCQGLPSPWALSMPRVLLRLVDDFPAGHPSHAGHRLPPGEVPDVCVSARASPAGVLRACEQGPPVCPRTSGEGVL